MLSQQEWGRRLCSSDCLIIVSIIIFSLALILSVCDRQGRKDVPSPRLLTQSIDPLSLPS